jgi:hypothetical protein
LQGASPGDQSAPSPPEKLLEDLFIAGKLSSPDSDEPSELGLLHQLLMALLLQKKE